MIVEFIGTTGSGKTTLLKGVQCQLAETAHVTNSVQLLTSRLGLRNITNPTAQNLVQELVSLPFFIYSLPRHRKFLIESVRLFVRNSHISMATINNLRSLERKIGVFEIAQRQDPNQIILVDEGPILAAHMLAYAEAAFTPQEIADFAALIPLPDLVVYVKAPAGCLVERLLRRCDPPREMKSKDRMLIESYTQHAAMIFDELIRAAKFLGRVLIIENPESVGEGRARVVDTISQFILRHASSGSYA